MRSKIGYKAILSGKFKLKKGFMSCSFFHIRNSS